MITSEIRKIIRTWETK